MNSNNLKNGIVGDILTQDTSSKTIGDSISAVVCNKSLATEVGGDFTIPDHLPDIRKLVKVDVRPSPASKFLTGDGAQLGGGVEYLATYLGSDGEIYGASFSGEFAAAARFS